MPPSRPVPDVQGLIEAHEAKLAALGSDVTFLAAPVNTWPAGTAINADTGAPYDPTITPASVTREQFVVRCGVAFRAFSRGNTGESVASPAGWADRTRVFVIGPWAARAQLHRAVAFIFHDAEFQVNAIKDDEIIGGYRRVLIYGAAK